MSDLSEEILLNILSYTANTREVISAAGLCRSWRNVIRGSNCASLLQNLAKKQYPSLLKVTPSTLNGIENWFDFLVRIERVCLLADEKRRRNLNNSAESFRGRTSDLVGISLYLTQQPTTASYQGPTSGTTATSVPDANGRFAEPVYYDWGANWDQVAELIETEEVQQVLMRCVDEVADGYYFNDWDENTIWPFLFLSHRRYGNGEQESLLAKHLSPPLVRELNDIAADRLLSEGEAEIASDRREVAVKLALWELEEGTELDEEVMNEEVEEMFDDISWFDSDSGWFYESELHQNVHNHVTKAAEAIIYSKSGPGSVREVLLCTMGDSFSFMPLNYILAKLVSPSDTRLKLVQDGSYSVVYDEKRNIVFDNFWYFLGIPASEALEKSMA